MVYASMSHHADAGKLIAARLTGSRAARVRRVLALTIPQWRC